MKKTYSKTNFCITGAKSNIYRWQAMVEFKNGHTFSTRSADIDVINPFLEALDEKKVDAYIACLVESLSKTAWALLRKYSKGGYYNYIDVTIADKISVEIEHEGMTDCRGFEDISKDDAKVLHYLLEKIETLK